ncbi:Mu transposase C-terminal domain-containing protein [Sulfitobacter sp. W027]|uniref:Mu transposase C-terminal domain-containing protein n=2 Tax=unclassified Sulfitobacter TaxID=196795 RepID=UPI0021A80557|nr:Mu transposase C-terminal domain-containing protein [Sulfitobacter sp. W027]UWR33529.1 Mu transposase C-terminal domain-containing protein [Sulfitobacter sp. W027]
MNQLQAYDGRHLRNGETLYRVIGRVQGKPSVVLDLNGMKTEITLEEFHRQIALGNVSEGQAPVFCDRIMSDDELSEAAFRKRILELADRYQELGLKWDEVMDAIRIKLQNDPHFASRASKLPAVRTIQKYRKDYCTMGQLGLVDKRNQSGNYTVRYDEIFREVVLDLLESSYLTSDRMNMTELVRESRRQYLKRFSEQRSKGKPGNHGEKAVKSIIDSYIPHSDVIKRRQGKKAARKALLQAGSFQMIEHAYDRLETDSTQADIYVIYDGKLIRPWVTIVIDAATGFIVGLVVSLENPTGLTTATALYEAMTGNDEEFFDRFGIVNRVSVAGHPLTVVADQGSENSGSILNRLLSMTAIELQKNIPGHPEKKPFVERAMSTFKNFVTRLDGATQTRELSPKERYERAKAEACWTFDEFVQKVQVWRYDVYGVIPRRRVQSPLKRRESPIESWRRLTTEYYVPEPPRKQQLTQMFFHHAEKRTVHKYGIEVGYVQYSSEELRMLEKDAKSKLVVEVRINPADIREIIVSHPKSGKAFYASCKDPDMPAISVAERDRIIALNRRDPDDYLSATEVLAALVAGKHHKPSKATTKGRKEQHAARRKRRDDEIMNRSNASNGPAPTGNPSYPTMPVLAPKRRNRISARGKST